MAVCSRRLLRKLICAPRTRSWASLAFAEYSAARAPCTSSILKYPSPHLLIDPWRRLVPEECSRGVSPSQEAWRRGLGKVPISPTAPASLSLH